MMLKRNVVKAIATAPATNGLLNEEDVMKSRTRLGGYILIALGLIFLLSNLGWLPGLRLLMRQWWPLILIIVGVLAVMHRP